MTTTTNNSDLLVTGGSGMVGHAIKSFFPKAIYLSSKDYNLLNASEAEAVFEKYKPRYVIHLAARVGGVKTNTELVSQFYSDNILINTNVLNAAAKYKTSKLVSLLSTCIYPDEKYIQYPLTEDQLHLGPPHESNFGYANAKRMLDVHSRALRNQYGCNFVCAIPNNIIGPHDNFDLNNAHVVPALIRKFWEAKNERKKVVIWGDGSSVREFTYSLDIARALLFLLFSVSKTNGPVNIGNTKEYSIKNMATKIAKIFDFDEENIIWDTSMPKGQQRKPSSNAKFKSLGFDLKTYTDIDTALLETCNWFKNQYPYVRGIKGELPPNEIIEKNNE